MKRNDLRIEVSGIRAGSTWTAQLAVTAFLPDRSSLADPPIVMFAIPGGGYSRGYFDMHFPGHRDYSQAEHHVAQGILFIAMDPLGVGDSTFADLAAITIDDLVATYDEAVRQTVNKIRKGIFTDALPALPDVMTVGIGQSMGGCISIMAQGRHATFDAVAPLGYSAIHTMLPQRTEAQTRQVAAVHSFSSSAQLHSGTIAESSAMISDFRYPFHWDDEPEDIVAADFAGGYPIRTQAPPFGSATIPTCAVLMMSPGAVAAEAAAIKVPVLIGVGERDVCPDPHAEPGAYRSSRDVSLLIVPRMAHMHNFSNTRQRLWDRLVRWSRAIATDQSGRL